MAFCDRVVSSARSEVSVNAVAWGMWVCSTGLAGNAMDGCMNEHGGRFHGMPTRQLVAPGIDEHDVLGLDFVPHQPAWIEQEEIRIAWQGHTEMIADAFAQATPRALKASARSVRSAWMGSE